MLLSVGIICLTLNCFFSLIPYPTLNISCRNRENCFFVNIAYLTENTQAGDNVCHSKRTVWARTSHRKYNPKTTVDTAVRKWLTQSLTSTILRTIDVFNKSTKLPSTHNTNITTVPARQTNVSRFVMELKKTCHHSHVLHWYKWHVQTSVLVSWTSCRPRSHFLRFWIHFLYLYFAVSSRFNLFLFVPFILYYVYQLGDDG